MGKLIIYYAAFFALFGLSAFHANRSFILAIISSVLAISYCFIFRRRSPGLVTALLLTILGLLASLIFLYESDSSLGRLLIYKISWLMFKEHYLMGIGSFKSQYLEYQAQYFCNGTFSTKEMLLADNTFFAFNDYWEWIVEYGIGAIFLLITFAFLIFYMTRRCWLIYRYKAPLLLLLAITSLFVILIAACFNHVFDSLFYRCSFLSLLIIIGYYSISTKKRTWVFFVFFGVGVNIIAIGTARNFEIFNRRANEQWQEAKKLWLARYISESINVLAPLYPEMKHNEHYLGFYADRLLSIDKAAQAEPLFIKAIRIRPSNWIYERLGECYSMQNKTEQAEEAYKKSICMVPNRFGTRFSLFNFYLNTGQNQKALSLANEILNLPVKVPSAKVEYIKQQVKSEIHNL